ncbi:Retrotransposon-like protein 1 [Labeo rohita]|uniref:Retrotransposon-like protein 1 n=1 Tax=Labeo rohita TaxID=84645 RepID=A0ABQ8LDB0_LABRO|nr:Retrotransposon-like protein 1 [Labeo rohita]
MSLSRPYNKSSHVDPLTSRLVYPITEQSVTTGSSSFTPGHSDMDTDRILFRIKQGPRSLEQYTREFLVFANYSTLPDSTIIEIFCDGANEHLRTRLRREGPRSSLAAFVNFALMCVGSPCTVGVAKEVRDNADKAAAHPSRRLAVTPDHDATNRFSAWIAREMAR